MFVVPVRRFVAVSLCTSSSLAMIITVFSVRSLSLSLVSWLWLVVESVTLFLLFVSLVCNYSFCCIDNTACFYTLLLLAMFVR